MLIKNHVIEHIFFFAKTALSIIGILIRVIKNSPIYFLSGTILVFYFQVKLFFLFIYFLIQAFHFFII